MRFALLASTSLIGLALAMYACSSSDTPASTTADAGKGTGTTSSSGGSTTSSSGGQTSSSSSTTSSSGAPNDSGVADTGASSGGFDSGPPIDGGNAGTLCTAGAVQDSEPNDTAGQATPVDATSGSFVICGRLTPGDIDNFTFTFPATAHGYSGKFSGTGAQGSTIIDGTVGGTTYHVVPQGTPGMPLVTSSPTVLTVSAPGITTTVDYTFTMTTTN